MKLLSLVAGLATALFAAGAAIPACAAPSASDPSTIVFAAGRYDILHNDPQFGAMDYRLEYRWGSNARLVDFGSGIQVKPFAGVEVTSDEMVYGLGGFYADIPLGPFVLTPNIGVGYFDKGNGKDQGSHIEFRSTMELSIKVYKGIRVGASFGHISNAGITKKNPGAEILSFGIHIPTNLLF